MVNDGWSMVQAFLSTYVVIMGTFALLTGWQTAR